MRGGEKGGKGKRKRGEEKRKRKRERGGRRIVKITILLLFKKLVNK